MEGRRWSEGLHQAVEAKEGVQIQEEHVTLATITLQNYFRLYEKLAGMTGTAKTEEKEFVEIYDLHVVEIPTNVAGRARRRERPHLQDEGGEVRRRSSRTSRSATRTGQPVLVGTIAVETSEYLSQLLERQGIPHNVLNAKEHAREAEIIKDAGQPRRGHDRDEHGRPRRRHQARRGRARARRPLRARHRAPRGAPDRQPAPRPLGPPGRPRRVALLPLRPGRPRPAVRRRPDLQDHGPLQDPGRPADGGEDPLAPDRERAEEGRGAELRHAQERPQVRRRPEHAAARSSTSSAARCSRARTSPRRCASGSSEVVERDRRRSSRWPSTARMGSRRARAGDGGPVRDRRSRPTSCARRSASTARRSSRSSVEDALDEYAAKEEAFGANPRPASR